MRNILTPAVSIPALALSSSQPLVAQGDPDQQLGTFRSVPYEPHATHVAQRRFDRGIFYQHSYWYLNADEVFEELRAPIRPARWRHQGVARPLLDNLKIRSRDPTSRPERGDPKQAETAR